MNAFVSSSTCSGDAFVSSRESSPSVNLDAADGTAPGPVLDDAHHALDRRRHQRQDERADRDRIDDLGAPAAARLPRTSSNVIDLELQQLAAQLNP